MSETGSMHRRSTVKASFYPYGMLSSLNQLDQRPHRKIDPCLRARGIRARDNMAHMRGQQSYNTSATSHEHSASMRLLGRNSVDLAQMPCCDSPNRVSELVQSFLQRTVRALLHR